MPDGPQAVRSVVAVGAGFFTFQVLALAAEIAAGSGHTPLVRIVYLAVLELVGGYITARLAIRNPIRHALILGLILLAFSAGTAVLTWDAAPVWYHVVTLLLIVPLAMLGGKLRELQVRHASG